MHYVPEYYESDEDNGFYLSEAINRGLVTLNQTDTVFCDFCVSSPPIPSPTSMYGDSPFFGATNKGNL